MSIRSIVRDGFESLCRSGFEFRLLSHRGGKSHGGAVLHDPLPISVDWDDLPPELLRDVMERLEASEDTWPSRKHVVACAAVCRTWRDMCKEIVRSPEFSGKITFPPGPRDEIIQCFIKRDKSTQTYYLYLCLSSGVLLEHGKFLLSAKINCHSESTEYIISMGTGNNISKSTNTYVGKLRGNFLGTKFKIYDTTTQPLYGAPNVTKLRGLLASQRQRQRLYSKKGSRYSIVAQVSYERNVFGPRRPGRMSCVMHTPSSDEFSTVIGGHRPLVLRNKVPIWLEQRQCWCLNFRYQVVVPSVKNFQLLAATTAAPSPEQEKVVLEFGKVAKDLFTMDYSYPLSAFQAFAICLSYVSR